MNLRVPTKSLFLSLFVLATFLSQPGVLFSQDCTGKLTVSKIEKDGKIYFYAVNLDPWFCMHVKFEISSEGPVEFSAPLPVEKVVPAGKKILLGCLTQGRFASQTDYHYNYGDPNAVPDPNAVYLFPYEHGVKHGVVQGYFGKLTHQSCQCLDFDLKENSPVCATRDGQVVLTRADSDIGGPGPQYEKDSNYIIILHADGTWASYDHLRKNGVAVKLGQRVKAGQVIGYSGHTGEAWGPHLHFEVQKADWDGDSAGTIPTLFLQQQGQTVSAVEGKYYYSYHPGGPAFKEIKAEMYTEALLDNYAVPAAKNDAVTVRTYELDGQTLYYGSNGTARDITFTLEFPTLNNFSCSKTLPYSKVIPAGKEVYFLRLEPIDLHSPSSASSRYTYR